MSTCLPIAPAPTRPPVAAWPRGVRLGLALAAGALVGLAFEPAALWPAMLVGIALFVWLLDPQARGGRGFWLGYVFGLGLGAVSLAWLTVLIEGVGVLLAMVLIGFEALFFGLLGVLIRLVRRLNWWPLAVGLCWGTVEFAYSRVPFGGFGWIRLGYAQVDAPLAGLFPVIGVAGVSVLTATLGAGLAWLAGRLLTEPRRWLRPVTLTLGMLIGLAGLTTAGRSYDPEPSAGHGQVTVGMVQGNVDGGAGLGAMGRARSVTNNHLGETVTLMTGARAGVVPMPDFVVWPENSTDIDPEKDAQTRTTVTAAADLAERPILVGAVTAGPAMDERQTTSLWWNPSDSAAAAGGPVTDRYHKRNLVPFGEYIPFRDVLLPAIPLLKLVGAQSVPGEGPGVLEGRLGDGRTIDVGTVICFELAYDATVHRAVRGSEVLVVQSNNATYLGTAQIPQQFAITRVRAMEARREVVVATTNAVSGHIDRNGRVLAATSQGTAASGSYPLPLRSTLTPAVRWAAAYDGAIIAGTLTALAWAFLAYRRAARSPRKTQGDRPEWAADSPSAAPIPTDMRRK